MKQVFLTALFASVAWAAPAAAESIRTYDVHAVVDETGHVLVTERIVYDFGTETRHGIYRDIPVRYERSYGSFRVRISDIDVRNENGLPYQFAVEREGIYQRIRIGDPDTYVSGEKVYAISYTVSDAILFFKDHDELYWNAVGTGWVIPIEAASVDVALPKQLDEASVQIACYTGAAGAQDACAHKRLEQFSETTHALFTQQQLGSGEGLTVVVGFPKGIIPEPSWFMKAWGIVRDNWFVGLPLMTLLVMWYLWHTRGRDPRGRGTIIPEYEPPEGLTPGQVGTLIDQKAHAKDVSAEIIMLAVLGYLRISRLVEDKLFKDSVDYELTQLKHEDEALVPHQRTLLEGLFAHTQTGGANFKAVRLSELREKFYTTLTQIKDELYTSLIAAGYFSGNPQLLRAGYLFVGFFLIAFVVPFAGNLFGGLAVASLVISGVIIILFGLIMPKRTYHGVLAREKALGFEEYLTVAEKDRLAFHNAPEKNPALFERFLPYAMAFGVEKQWAEQFKDIYTKVPSWYSDPSGASFNAVIFSQSMRGFAANAGTSLSARPGSGASGFGGGGFSGGGFGGGGGGSW